MSNLSKEENLLSEASQKLLEASLKSGAQAAEVCSSYVIKTKISLEKQDFHLTSSDEGYRFGLRVLSNNKQGFSSCNTLDPKELREVATRAVQIAAFSPENPYNAILPAENIPKEAPQPVFDEALHDLSLQTQKEWTKLLRDEALKDPRFKINEGSVEIVSAVSEVLNSTGVRKLEADTYCSWGLMGMGVQDKEITSFDYFHWITRKSKEVQDLLITSTRAFTKEVLNCLKSGPAKSYKGKVLLTPRAVLDILVDGLTYHLNGRNLVEGTARWKFSDLEKIVFNSMITLEDKPWDTHRSGFTLFDREGTPTSNRTLVQNGALKSFLLDHYAAIALKSHSTGNAAGGSTSTPTVSAHSLSLKAGTDPLQNLMQKAGSIEGEYLLVHRYSGQVDPVTGEFSGVAKGSEWCKGTEKLYTVKETLISGNIFESLGKALLGISKETKIIDAGEEAPYVLIDNVSVTTHAS